MKRIQSNPSPSVLGMVTQAPTGSQEEHEDVFKNAFGEFTRMQ
jgi:hypothetical protein